MSDDTTGGVTFWGPGARVELVRVQADGSIFICGREASPAMAEALLRKTLSGDELDRALAYLRSLTASH